jgi:hypothetical protein
MSESSVATTALTDASSGLPPPPEIFDEKDDYGAYKGKPRTYHDFNR